MYDRWTWMAIDGIFQVSAGLAAIILIIAALQNIAGCSHAQGAPSEQEPVHGQG